MQFRSKTAIIVIITLDTFGIIINAHLLSQCIPIYNVSQLGLIICNVVFCEKNRTNSYFLILTFYIALYIIFYIYIQFLYLCNQSLCESREFLLQKNIFLTFAFLLQMRTFGKI